MKKEDEKGEAEWVEEGRRHRKIEKKCTLKDGRKDGILAGVGVQYFDTVFKHFNIQFINCTY